VTCSVAAKGGVKAPSPSPSTWRAHADHLVTASGLKPRAAAADRHDGGIGDDVESGQLVPQALHALRRDVCKRRLNHATAVDDPHVDGGPAPDGLKEPVSGGLADPEAGQISSIVERSTRHSFEKAPYSLFFLSARP